MRLVYISHRRGMPIVFLEMIVMIKSAKSVSVAIFAMCLTDKLHVLPFPDGVVHSIIVCLKFCFEL